VELERVMLQPADAVSATNVADTVLAADIGKVQVALEPLQLPDQPENFQPVEGVAVRVKAVFWGTLAEQVPELQLIAPDDTTEPVPAMVTFKVTLVIGGATTCSLSGVVTEAKVAVTSFAEDIVTEQVPVPEQAPPQPVKVYPSAGAADKV